MSVPLGGVRALRMGRGRRGWAAPVMAVVAALLLAACGTGVDAAPQIVNKSSVPYGLTSQAPPSTAAEAPSAYVTVYLAGTQRLVAVSRPVTAPVTITTILRALDAGPTHGEAAHGLESPVSSAAPLGPARTVNTVVTIDVSSSFTTLAQKQQEFAVAQLVYTVTAFPGVSSVEIRIHGKAVDVPTENGTLTRGPLTRASYASLAPF